MVPAVVPLISMAGIASACAPQSDADMDAPAPDDSASVEEAGSNIDVRVELWRDTQPGAEENPLMAVVVVAAEREPGPQQLPVEEVVLVYDSQSWRASPADETRMGPAAAQFTMRGGPAWPAGALVNVTVRVRTDRKMKVDLERPRIEPVDARSGGSEGLRGRLHVRDVEHPARVVEPSGWTDGQRVGGVVRVGA